MQLMVDWQGAPDCAVRQEVWHCEHGKWLLWFSLAVLSFGLKAWDSFTFSYIEAVRLPFFLLLSRETSGVFRYPRTCDVGNVFLNAPWWKERIGGSRRSHAATVSCRNRTNYSPNKLQLVSHAHCVDAPTASILPEVTEEVWGVNQSHIISAMSGRLL